MLWGGEHTYPNDDHFVLFGAKDRDFFSKYHLRERKRIKTQNVFVVDSALYLMDYSIV
jgi:hypothetical protein